MLPADVVACPLCGTPCRIAAGVCDTCGQALGEEPDLPQLRAEELELTKRLAGFGLAAAGTLVVSILLPLGWVLLLLPGAGLFDSASRLRAIRGRLRRLERGEPPTSF